MMRNGQRSAIHAFQVLGSVGFLIVMFATWTYSAATSSYSLVDALSLDLARPTSPIRMVSSTDPKKGNHDFVLMQPGQTLKLATIKGPVTILRVWFTGGSVKDLSVQMSLVNGGKTRTIPLRKKGAFAGFPATPELGAPHLTSYYSYFPLDARDSFELVVTNHSRETNKFYYQMNFREGLTTASPAECRAAAGVIRVRMAKDDIAKSVAVLPMPTWQGKQAVLRGADELTIQAKGAGTTHAIRIQLRRSKITELDDFRLEVTPVSEKVPGVVASLPALFGEFYSEYRYSSAFARVSASDLWKDGSSWLLIFPMPHRSDLRITLKNTGNRITTVDLRHLTTPSSYLPPYRLCAREVTLKSERGKPLDLLDTKGEGSLVGLTLGCKGTFQRNFAMLEGDETIVVDNDRRTSLQGTGTEDFFNSSWYFPDKPFARPFHGLTHKSTPPASVSAFRWLWSDRIPFRKRLQVLLEHGGRNNTEGVAYQAVVLWYQKPREN